MNENNYYNYNDDMEINLLDMLFYLLKHWRSLIAAILIGVVLGGGIYAVKKITAPEPTAVSAEPEATQEEKVEKEYQVNPDVKSNMELAYQYRQLYKKQLEYNQKSVIMQLDPNAVYVGELKYYISAGYNTGLVSVLYQNILSDKNLLQELQDVSGLECDASYIKELISCSINKENDSSININNMMEVTMEENNDVVKNSFVVYTVVSTSEESCRQMLQVIKEKAAILDQECQDNYEGYSSLEVNDAVRLVTNNDYLNKQKANIDQLNTYWANIQKLESTFSGDEQALAYYNQVYLSRTYVTSEEKEEPAAVVPEVMVGQEPINPVKWLAIGAILGIICWGGYYCLRYLLDPTIKTSDEIQSYYRLPVIGCLEREPVQKKGFDGWLDCLYGRCKNPVDSVNYVAAAVDSLQQEKLLACGNASLAAVTVLMQQLSGKCRKLSVGGLVSQDNKTLEDAKRADGVILAVQVGATRRAELQRELEVCRLQGIPVTGIVVVE